MKPRDIFSLLRVRAIGRLNPIKALQVRDIKTAISQSGASSTLDVGCGSGYLAVEIATTGVHVKAIDVKTSRHWQKINNSDLPVQCILSTDLQQTASDKFDAVLLSEVISETMEPSGILTIYEREVKGADWIVVVTSYGRPHVLPCVLGKTQENAMSREHYEASLSAAFSDNSTKMHSKKDIVAALADFNFVPAKSIFSISIVSATIFETFQYLMLKAGMKPYGIHFAPLVPVLKVTNLLFRKRSNNYEIQIFQRSENRS